MTSKEYIDGAIRTESGRFDAQNVDPATVKAVLTLFAAAGQALDILKRALFYGKPLNQLKYEDAVQSALLAAISCKASNPVELAGYSTSPAVHPRLVHAAMGLGTESAEVIEKVLKSFEDRSDFDYDNLFEELSDVNWYMAIAIDAARHEDPKSNINRELINEEQPVSDGREWTYESIWEKNLAKLKARYPDKFSTENAFNRNLTAERQALS